MGVLLLALPTVLLSACGGGGGGGGGGGESGGPILNTSAEGAYAGTASRSLTANTPRIDATNDLHLVVLASGQYWAITSFNTSGVYFPAGFVTGQFASLNSHPLLADTTDYSLAARPAGTMAAIHVSSTSFSASVTDPAGSINLTAAAMPATQVDFAQTPSLATISGTWNFRDRSFNPGVLTISATGTLAGSAAGCDFTGTLAAHPSGRHVYTSQITFGPSPCSTPGLVVSGIAFTSMLPNGLRQLAVTGVSASRSFGTSWLAVR
ncbi:MAG: hypothetical protein RLZZ584_3475 [Pseudomonadota bacterium]|jgi:hypothetical protein